MVSENLSSEFMGLKERLAALERRFNPEGFNLHFGVQKSSKVWPGFWEELEQLAREGLEMVKKNQDYFISPDAPSHMYDDDMFWYDLFLLIHGAGISHAVSKPPLGEACHDSVGMASPHRTFYLPDGESSNGYETWTLVQNPNPTDVTVQVTYMTPTGKGNVTRTETVKGNSRKTFSMAEHSGIQGRAAIMVRSKTSGKKIMVERAMYWNSRGAGTDTIGGYGD